MTLTGAVVALDHQGSQVWRLELPTNMDIVPELAAGTLVIVDFESTAYGLFPDTGALRWTLRIPGQGRGMSHALGIASDVVLVAGVSVTGTLCAVDAANGTILWTAESGAEQWAAHQVDEYPPSPEQWGRIVWIGTQSDDLVLVLRHLVIGIPDEPDETIRYELIGLDPANGMQLWNFTSHEISQPLLSHGAVYFGAADADDEASLRFYALDARTGSEQWVYRARPSIDEMFRDVSNPSLVADSGAICAVGIASILALDQADGSYQWHAVVDQGLLGPTTVATDGILYIDQFRKPVGSIRRWDISAGAELKELRPYSYILGFSVLDGILFIRTDAGIHAVSVASAG